MTTERRTTNMNSVYSNGEPQTEFPDQVAQNIVPSTYEKDTNPLSRLKEGMKKMVGKATRGVGPKHSRAKPKGITGKQHAEETAIDMYGLHDALHEGLDNRGNPTLESSLDNNNQGGVINQGSQTSPRAVPPAHQGADGSDPKRIINESERTRTGAGTFSGETIMDKIRDRKPIYNDLDLQNTRGELKHVSAPATGLSEAARTAFLEERRERGKDTIGTRRDQDQLPSRSVTAGEQIPSHDRDSKISRHKDRSHHEDRSRHEDRASRHEDRREESSQQWKDPAEGITPGVKAAFLEDQRERAILGNERFELGRADRSMEGGEPGIGSKLLAGLTTVAQTATQGLKSAATMITGPKTDTTETTS